MGQEVLGQEVGNPSYRETVTYLFLVLWEWSIRASPFSEEYCSFLLFTAIFAV